MSLCTASSDGSVWSTESMEPPSCRDDPVGPWSSLCKKNMHLMKEHSINRLFLQWKPISLVSDYVNKSELLVFLKLSLNPHWIRNIFRIDPTCKRIGIYLLKLSLNMCIWLGCKIMFNCEHILHLGKLHPALINKTLPALTWFPHNTIRNCESSEGTNGGSCYMLNLFHHLVTD
jgi:hypothetical protein